MPPRMGDLVGDVGQVPINNDQRHRAATNIAELNQERRLTALYLVMLGLATHDPDERFRSVPDNDGQSWFFPAAGHGEGIRLSAAQLIGS